MRFIVFIFAFLITPSVALGLEPQTAYLIKKTPLVEYYWLSPDCEAPCAELEEANSRVVEFQPFLEKIFVNRLEEFDAWATQHLSFWSAKRSSFFPVSIAILSTNYGLGARVDRFEFEYVDLDGVLQKASKRPIITTEIEKKSAWGVYSQMLTHELGHVLVYALGIPETFLLSEANADMLAMTFEPRGWKFMPEMGEEFHLKAERELAANPGDLIAADRLRTSSKEGLRDFTLANYPRFEEVNGLHDEYFASAMVMSTFYDMSAKVDIGRMSEAYLELLVEKPDVAKSDKIASTMDEMLLIYGRKYPDEFKKNSEFIRTTLDRHGWPKPK